MDSRALVVLWLVSCVCFGCLLALCIALFSLGKKLRILRQYMHDAPLPRFAGIEGDVGLVRMRCADMQEEVNGTVRTVDRLVQRLERVEVILEAEKRTDGSEAKLVGLALADRIDALSTRLDAVELACGVREKPKIMGGAE